MCEIPQVKNPADANDEPMNGVESRGIRRSNDDDSFPGHSVNLQELAEELASRIATLLSPGERVDLTISQASEISAINKGSISRAVQRGEIITNGKAGKQIRLDPVSFIAWAKDKSKPPEACESAASVEAKLRRTAHT